MGAGYLPASTPFDELLVTAAASDALQRVAKVEPAIPPFWIHSLRMQCGDGRACPSLALANLGAALVGLARWWLAAGGGLLCRVFENESGSRRQRTL